MAPLIKDNISRLLGQLNQTNLTLTNQPLYQVIKELINALDNINTAAGSISSSGSSGSNGRDGIPAFLLSDNIDNDIPSYIPGPKGDTGAAGASGISGISGFMVAEDGIDGLDSYIPGPAGPSGSSGGSLTWTVIATSTPTGTDHVDYTGLSAYAEIRVIIRLITYGSADNTVLRVSTDNGATFLNAATDYRTITGTGSESGVGSVEFYGNSATAGRSGEILIEGFNLTVPKVTRSLPDTSAVQFMKILPSTSAFNAIRVMSAGTTNFTGGTIYVLGR